MNSIHLPGTDLSPLPLALGIATIGVSNSEAEGKRLLDCFVDRGGSLIDTARIYSDWIPGELHRSERILGDWLAASGKRDDVIVSTKGGHYLFEERTPRLSPTELEDDLIGSLQSLRISTIDLYWLHRDDESRPVASIMDTLNRFKEQGMIRYYGASNWSVERIEEANSYATSRGYGGFVASQIEWNLGTFHRKPRGDDTMRHTNPQVIDFHRRTGLPAIPYSAQASGYFSKMASATEAAAASPYHSPGNQRLYQLLTVAAQELNISISHIVLAYLWSHPFPVIPNVGCRTEAQLIDSMGAVGCRLPVQLMGEIEKRTHEYTSGR